MTPYPRTLAELKKLVSKLHATTNQKNELIQAWTKQHDSRKR